MNASSALTSPVPSPPSGLRQIGVSELAPGRYYYQQRILPEGASGWTGWRIVQILSIEGSSINYLIKSQFTNGVWVPQNAENYGAANSFFELGHQKSETLPPAGSGGVGALEEPSFEGGGAKYGYWVPIEMGGGRRRRSGRKTRRGRRQSRRRKQTSRRN
jgi:hypothetical protein